MQVIARNVNANTTTSLSSQLLHKDHVWIIIISMLYINYKYTYEHPVADGASSVLCDFWADIPWPR